MREAQHLLHRDLHFNIHLRESLRSTDLCSLDPVKFPRQVGKWMKRGEEPLSFFKVKLCKKCFEKAALGRVARWETSAAKFQPGPQGTSLVNEACICSPLSGACLLPCRLALCTECKGGPGGTAEWKATESRLV